jgi:hypothetical protein
MEIDLSNSSWTGNWSQLCPTCKVLGKVFHHYLFILTSIFHIMLVVSMASWKQNMQPYTHVLLLLPALVLAMIPTLLVFY